MLGWLYESPIETWMRKFEYLHNKPVRDLSHTLLTARSHFKGFIADYPLVDGRDTAIKPDMKKMAYIMPCHTQQSFESQAMHPHMALCKHRFSCGF